MAYTQQTVLDGILYTLSFRWNSRSGRWFVDITDATGVILVAGICLLAGVALTSLRKHISGMPQGDFFVIDETGAERSPSLDDFGKEIKLVYYTPDTAGA